MQPADWDEAEVFEMDLEEAREIGLVPEHGLKERTVKFHSYFFGILDAYKYRCAKLEEHVFGAPAAQLAPSAQPAPPAQPSAAPSKAVPQQQKQAPRVRPPICLYTPVWNGFSQLHACMRQAISAHSAVAQQPRPADAICFQEGRSHACRAALPTCCSHDSGHGDSRANFTNTLDDEGPCACRDPLQASRLRHPMLPRACPVPRSNTQLDRQHLLSRGGGRGCAPQPACNLLHGPDTP